MKSINRIIEDLPLGASALVEERINNKNITFIIIKDRFKNFMEAPWDMEFNFKGGVIKKRKTLSVHLILQVKDSFNHKLYPFHFNYFDENSLKLLHNLTKQKEVFVVVSNGSNECITRTFNNGLGPFLKNYIKASIGFGYRWSNAEYKKAIVETIESFQDITELWDKLGEIVHMEAVKNRK